MNKTVKHILEFLAILVLTAVVALSSPFNPWIANAFTAVQEEILDIAYSVREGYLAYVELDGHYGPVVYEFFGLGYLLTDTHIVHFIMESVINFISILFLYKTDSSVPYYIKHILKRTLQTLPHFYQAPSPLTVHHL